MKRLTEALKRLGKAIGRVQAYIFFSLVYWLVLVPLSLLTGRRWDPLERKGRRPYWHPYAKLASDLDAWRRHF